MPRITPDAAGGKNVCAFLDTIAVSEISRDLLAKSDNGYNVLVGATAGSPLLFNGYAKHPRILNKALDSTAAGRYQFIWPTWSGLANKYRLGSFSPLCQDLACVGLLAEIGAIDYIVAGQFDRAISIASSQWASLPGSKAGQHINALDDLRRAYLVAGGTVSDHV